MANAALELFFTYFFPHFGPPGGLLAHPERPWLRHWRRGEERREEERRGEERRGEERRGEERRGEEGREGRIGKGKKRASDGHIKSNRF